MIIEKIEIDSFASHSGLCMEFSDGINLIEGSNESGKSSIADFIKFMLYGVGAKASDDHLAERKRVMNFNSSHIAGSMTVSVDGHRYRIVRNTAVSGTVRESVRTRICVIDTETDEDVYDGREPGEKLLGIPEDVFCASVYLSQRAEQRVSPSFSESISNILFSGDERLSVNKAVERIDAARIPLSHKHGKVGRIYDIRAELDTLKGRLAADMEANRRIIELEAAVNEKKNTNREQKDSCALLERKKRAYELAKLLESCEAVAGAEREKVASELSLLEYKASAHIPTDAEADELHTYERSLRSLETRLSELSAERAKVELEYEQLRPTLRFGEVYSGDGDDIVETVEKSKASAKKSFIFSVVVFIAAVSMAALSFIPGIAALPMYAASAILCAAGIAMLAAGLKNARHAARILDGAQCKTADQLREAVDRYKTAKARSDELDSDLDDNALRTSELTELLRAEKERLSAFLSEMDIEDRVESSLSIAKISDTLVARQRHAAVLEADAAEKRVYYEALRDKTDDVDVDSTRAELESLGVEDPICADPEKLDRNIRFYREQSELLGARIHSLELELAHLRASVSSPASISEKISELERELSVCERKHAVYVLAAEGLRTAAEELRRSVAPTLARISGEYMNTLTDGRYSQMLLDASFSLSYNSGGEPRHIDHMSTGTRDMAYLSLRLALGDVISARGGLLCVLDEAMAHMDDTRAGSLIRLLEKRASSGHQHLLFTCHTRESILLDRAGAKYNHIKM